MADKETTISYSKELRDRWPEPLAREWRERYPELFDEDDLRLAVSQPTYHFNEWFAAIHLFERDGAHSLVEKYLYKNHPAKAARLATVLTEQQRATLERIERTYNVQLPDLFVYMPGTHRFWFAEVKRPGERISAKQLDSHEVIARELGVPVEVIRVRVEAEPGV